MVIEADRRLESDAFLVAKTASGDESAYKTLYERHHQHLLAVLKTSLPSAVAEEAAQEAWARAYERIQTLEKPQAFFAWLMTIARNFARDHHRSTGAESLSLVGEHEWIPEPSPGPDTVVEHDEDRRLAARALQRLPDKQRAALLLRNLQGRSYVSIAGSLGLSVSATETLLHRARSNFHREYSSLQTGSDAPALACYKMRASLRALASGSLSDLRRLRVIAHLESCEPCRSTQEEMRRTRRIAGFLPFFLPLGWVRDKLAHFGRGAAETAGKVTATGGAGAGAAPAAIVGGLAVAALSTAVLVSGIALDFSMPFGGSSTGSSTQTQLVNSSPQLEEVNPPGGQPFTVPPFDPSQPANVPTSVGSTTPPPEVSGLGGLLDDELINPGDATNNSPGGPSPPNCETDPSLCPDDCLAEPTAPGCNPGTAPPCDELDPAQVGCQSELPCEDLDPNVGGCQTELPCEDLDPNTDGCQSELPCDDQDPNVEGCQEEPPCVDQDPDVEGCQEEPPCVDQDPNIEGCQPTDPCDANPEAQECQPPDPCVVNPQAEQCLPPCEDLDPNVDGCQTEPPCKDLDPNVDGCQTEPPCEDLNPNVDGCQAEPPCEGCQTEPPCEDRDPNVDGCQTELPCEDLDPNVDGCQTEPPCEDLDPNVDGCQTDPPCADLDPNVDGCQAEPPCEDLDPNVDGCQTEPPCEDLDPNAEGCQTEPPCEDLDPNTEGCQTEHPCAVDPNLCTPDNFCDFYPILCFVCDVAPQVCDIVCEFAPLFCDIENGCEITPELCPASEAELCEADPGHEDCQGDEDPCLANPDAEGCNDQEQSAPLPPDPCELDPNAEGCGPPVDPCQANPTAAGCPGSEGSDPCSINPQAEGCQPGCEATNSCDGPTANDGGGGDSSDDGCPGNSSTGHNCGQPCDKPGQGGGNGYGHCNDNNQGSANSQNASSGNGNGNSDKAGASQGNGKKKGNDN